MIPISRDEYESLKKEYLQEQGPNTGSNWLGKWGWYIKKSNEFYKIMKDKGFEVQ